MRLAGTFSPSPKLSSAFRESKVLGTARETTAIILLMFRHGLRVSELCDLRIKDLDLAGCPELLDVLNYAVASGFRNPLLGRHAWMSKT